MGNGTAVHWWQTRWFVAAMALLAIVPLLIPTVPPLIDLPGHMGRYRVMLGDDAATLRQWYDFHWLPIGYLGVDLLVAGIAPLLGLELTVKLIAMGIPALMTIGILWLSREAHGRIQPLALFALPLAYSLPFQYGFLNYSLAMALTINAFALWLRLGRLNRVGLRAAIFVPLACLIWTAHLFGWLILGVLVFCAEMMREREADRGWAAALFRAGIACLPLALPVVMFLVWRPGDGHAGSDYLASLRWKPGWLATVLRDRWAAFDIASIALIALATYRCARSASYGHARQLTAAAVGLFILFIAMPFGSAYADARIAPYIVVMAVLAVGARIGTSHRELSTIALIGLAFVLVRMTATTVSFAIEGRAWDRHLAALDHVPHGARVAVFATSPCAKPWRMYRLGHLGGMAIVRRAAFSNDQFNLGGSSLLRVTAPGSTGFAMDPSQIVMATPCPDTPEFRTLAQALASFPRERFDYVWLITAPPRAFVDLAGLQPVWTDGADMLLRVARPPLSPRPPAR